MAKSFSFSLLRCSLSLSLSLSLSIYLCLSAVRANVYRPIDSTTASLLISPITRSFLPNGKCTLTPRDINDATNGNCSRVLSAAVWLIALRGAFGRSFRSRNWKVLYVCLVWRVTRFGKPVHRRSNWSIDWRMNRGVRARLQISTARGPFVRAIAMNMDNCVLILAVS